MNNIIISLGAGENQIPLIKAIKKENFDCLAFDINKDAPGKNITNYFVPMSSHDYESIIEYILKNGFESKLAGVLTRSTGNPVYSASKIAERFNLVYIESNIAEIIIDKNKLLNNLNKFKVPSPKLYNFRNVLHEKIHFPLFVKPSKTNKSHLKMSVCNNLKEVEESVKEAENVSENYIANVEEFLNGIDTVSIDFVKNGKVMHVCSIGELTTGKPNYKGIGWFTCFEKAEKPIAKTILQFVQNLNVKNGFFQTAMKTDLKFQNSKIYEIHGEIGGDFVSDGFIPKAFGNYDLFKENIKFSIGNDINLPKTLEYCVLLFKEAINFEELKKFHISFVEEKGFYFGKFENENSIVEFLEKIDKSSEKVFFRN